MVSAMTPESAQRRDKVFALMRRVIQLGCLLPRRDDFDPDRADEYELVLREMHEVRAAMDEVLADEGEAGRQNNG
jgi:hypothetical protein